MIEKLADSLTTKFINSNILRDEDREIYNYCFQAVISVAINYGLILLLSIILKEFICSLVFILSFLVFRKTSGGYHASSYLKCEIMSILSYLVLILIIKQFELVFRFSILFLLLGLIIILFLSPIQDDNKPFTEKQQRRFKIISKSLASLFIVMFAILELCGYHNSFVNKYFFSFCYGIDLVAFSLLISKIERSIKNGKG